MSPAEKVVAGIDLGGTAINYTFLDERGDFLIDGLCEHPARSVEGPETCIGQLADGLVMAAATFGHIPAIFVPAGPMMSGLPNDEKARVRNLYAEGKATREELMAAEMASYHGPGTCTFYGTANTNQMLMEVMGLHLPGASFVNPGTPLREALTVQAVRRAAENIDGPAAALHAARPAPRRLPHRRGHQRVQGPLHPSRRRTLAR